MGQTHSFSAQSIPFFYNCGFRAVLHTLCGRNPQKTEKQARRYGFLNAVCDFDSVISNPEIDIVDICTPNPLHYPQAKAAILAGKHVYCDKPLCVTASQADELAELSEKHSVCCQVTFQHRFWPGLMHAKEILDAGGIGNITNFRAVFLHASLVDKNRPYAWRNAPVSEGGGVLNDLGSHILDLIMYLCGDAEDIKAMLKTLYPIRRDENGEMLDVLSDDAAYMLLKLKNGACAAVLIAEVSKIATGLSDVLKIEIHGTDGALFFDFDKPGQLKYSVGNSNEIRIIDCQPKYPGSDFLNSAQKPGWARAHIHSYYTFLSSVFNKTAPSPSFADAAKVQHLIETARKNAEC